jgi:hypothetical protein
MVAHQLTCRNNPKATPDRGGPSYTQTTKETIMAEPQPQGDSMPPDITPISEPDSLKALETTDEKEA